MRALRVLLTALMAVTLVLLPSASQANHDLNEFRFQVLIDNDRNGTTESQAADLKYLHDLSTPTLDAEAGWVDGDRKAYACGYSFLRYRGFIVGRVTVARATVPASEGGTYSGVSDKYMAEGQLNYDGTVPVEGNTTQGGTQQAVDTGKSCPGPATEPYVAFEGTFPAAPVVTYQHGPHAIEVRDFADSTDVQTRDTRVKWVLHSATDTRVVVLGYQSRLPVVAVYYDLVADPVNGLEVGQPVPGTMHHASMHVGCGLNCVHEHH